MKTPSLQALKKLPKSHLRPIHENAAGIDLGSRSHFVSVPPDRHPTSIQEFECFTSSLNQMVAFLKECQMTTIAMESTGVYWLPVYELLEASGFEVYLVNARHLKNVPGKKNDAKDADWLRELHSYGLLSASFVPESHIRELRNYWRLRQRHVQSRSKELLHMQKALD